MLLQSCEPALDCCVTPRSRLQLDLSLIALQPALQYLQLVGNIAGARHSTMVLWFLAGGAAIKISKEMEFGKQRMDGMIIHSRRTLDLPRSISGIPRAMSRRCLSSSGSRNLDREIVFDEASDRIYVQTSASLRERLM